ncbi:hypothetical protein [Rhizobium tropici]|uniref:Glycosyltransferase n=1 Tax=Rhizobium tropici TaxID=398 RepID=A0A329Y3A4_RHITR|nr:hypothetical protein [Rhizobium tropici]RAX37923.1 hypothetical protein DQ393_30055 [Rhizobium tropici]
MSEIPTIFVATPCFGGLVTKDYMQSVLSMMQVAAQNDLKMTLALLGNDALITRSRNSLVSSFINMESATHLLFVDADIGFEPDQVLRLFMADKDVVGGMYPIKDYDWSRMPRLSSSTDSFSEDAIHYVGTPLPDSVAEWDGDFVTGIYAGTGMLMIKRAVIERMIALYPELRYSGVHAFPKRDPSPTTQYALFECLIDDETGLYLSEDFAFCQRWRKIGGKIWLDTAGRLTHTGAHKFSGNPASRYNHRARYAASPPQIRYTGGVKTREERSR